MSTVVEIPNKSHFKQSEVCGLTGVRPYVLRFWESEFDEISPTLSSSGQKLYEHKDIEAILLIKKLLFEDKFKIEDARIEIKKNEYQLLLGVDPQLARESDISLEGFEEGVDEVSPATCRRGFGDDEIQKLVQAKAMLRAILRNTESLKERHHWS